MDMKSVRNLIVTCAALLLAVTAMAQGGGGQGRGGFGRGMMGADPTGTMLLQRPDVQKELNINDDQKTKIAALQDKMRTDMRDVFQNSNGDQTAMREGMQKLMAQTGKDAQAILTKEQATRLKEVNIQLAGNQAATFPDVQKDLGLSDDQISKIKDLGAKQQEANMALFQKMRDQEITREELQTSMTKNTDTYKAELGKILTDAQRAKLKAMGGKEFKEDKGGGL